MVEAEKFHLEPESCSPSKRSRDRENASF